MLKAIVQQVNARLAAGIDVFFGPAARVISQRAHHYRTFESARDQQRLIAEAGGDAAGINLQDSFGSAAIAARENIDRESMFEQKFAQPDHKGRFSRAAD